MALALWLSFFSYFTKTSFSNHIMENEIIFWNCGWSKLAKIYTNCLPLWVIELSRSEAEGPAFWSDSTNCLYSKSTAFFSGFCSDCCCCFVLEDVLLLVDVPGLEIRNTILSEFWYTALGLELLVFIKFLVF